MISTPLRARSLRPNDLKTSAKRQVKRGLESGEKQAVGLVEGE
jgi:hypothetical protein